MSDFGVTNTFSNGTTADGTEVNTNFDDVEDLFNGNADSYVQAPTMAPIGTVVAWLKTFITVDSGTTDTNTTDALEDSGADFVNDGVLTGMIVANTTDTPDSFAIANVVTANKITLLGDINGGSSTTDIFPDGTDAYSIYKTPELPEGWVECNGQTLSGAFADADSPYNGGTIPDLNASSGTERFLRGSISSGTTGGSEDHLHSTSLTSGNQSSG
ncbi:hypothetical protein LCGC14_1421250, partial [marine sediment metagenome]